MRNKRHLWLAVAIAVVAVTLVTTAFGTTAARAQTTGATFNYSGTDNDNRTLLDTGLVLISGCDDITDDPVTCFPDWFPGTMWFRIRAGVKSTVITTQPAAFTLDNPDTFRQDTHAGFSSTLVPQDGAAKEVKVTTTPWVNVDAAYDAPLANCGGGYLAIPDVDTLSVVNTSGCLNLVLHTGEVDISTFTLLNEDTTLPYTGDRNLSNTASSPTLDIGAFVGLPGILGAKLNFTTALKLTATDGYLAQRTIASSSDPGTPLVSGALNWPSADPVNDDVVLPCTVPAGDNLIYKLSDNHWGGTGKATGTVSVTAVALPGSLDIDLKTFNVLSATIFDSTVRSDTTDFTKTLGEVLAENKPPVVTLNTPSPSTGSEGSAVHFSAVATDNCDSASQLTSVWNFSDGGVGYGPSVYHTFADNGTYGYQLTVCDRAGNCTTVHSSITVNNVTPTVDAGPDRQSDWGIPVALHANGSDPGSPDNSGLLYSWNFNDTFDPVGAAGQDVSHVFSQPGTYGVVVTVLDKDGASSTDTVQVTVTPRDTPISYTGDVAGNITDTAHFRATLTDEYGQPVVGRTVTFRFDGTGVVSALTNGFGVAQANWAIPLGTSVGNHTVDAQFAGDSLYKLDGTAPVTFVVSKENTVLTYTSVASSKPSSRVVLTAKLTDDEGNPIAGKTIVFTLGTQGCSATTDAFGVATCNITKLTQKSGLYKLGTNFAGDTNFNAASDLDTFKIG